MSVLSVPKQGFPAYYLIKSWYWWLSNLLILSVPDEGYSRNVSIVMRTKFDVYVFYLLTNKRSKTLYKNYCIKAFLPTI
jgi:hypothetical protein